MDGKTHWTNFLCVYTINFCDIFFFTVEPYLKKNFKKANLGRVFLNKNDFPEIPRFFRQSGNSVAINLVKAVSRRCRRRCLEKRKAKNRGRKRRGEGEKDQWISPLKRPSFDRPRPARTPGLRPRQIECESPGPATPRTEDRTRKKRPPCRVPWSWRIRRGRSAVPR